MYVPGLESLIDASSGRVAVVEIEPATLAIETPEAGEAFTVDPGRTEWLRGLRHSKLVHGVGYPVGGIRAPDPRHLPPFRRFIEALGAPWASEHLAFNRVSAPTGSFATGFMLPPRQTHAGARAAAATIREVAGFLSVPFAVETGVNYLRPRRDELRDGSFVCEVATQADCGILLDIHNIWANQRNGRQTAREFLDDLPLERVWELHVAGGLELNGYWLDAHSGEVPPEVLDLAIDVVGRFPNLGAIILEIGEDYVRGMGERRVEAQLESLWRVWDGRRRTAPSRHSRGQDLDSASVELEATIAPAEWESTLGALVIGRTFQSPLGGELLSDPGLAVLRTLVSQLRASIAVDALTLTTRLLRLAEGEEAFLALLRAFWDETPPPLFQAAEGEAFAAFILRQRPTSPYLQEVVSFELARLRAQITGASVKVRFEHEPTVLLGSLSEGRLPTDVPLAPQELEVTPPRPAYPGGLDAEPAVPR